MNMNPYEVLGVDENADDATIKKAYRELVKKYHPDRYKDNPLEGLAKEKLQQINEAYDTIMKMRANGGAATSSASGSYTGSSYSANSDFAYIRNLFSQRRYDKADAELNRRNDGSAEWHFLKGCVCMAKGWNFDGIRHLQTAVNMDPSNMEYRNVLNNINMRGSSYNQWGNQRGYGSSGVDMCNCCSNLLCADCCCEMLGGDLISCC